MDATRTPLDYLCRCVEAAIRAGATTINLPDTVGYALPDEYRAMFRGGAHRVPDADKAIFSVHCHNDLGLAVANTLAGLEGGARQVECTINGIGERAGNAALEEVVMALRTRGDACRYASAVEATMLTRARKLVSAVTVFPVQYNKAIVGRNAFAHESGIHQDGMLKNASTYEIMTPESVGVSKTEPGDGQAFGPRRLPLEAARARLRTRRQRHRGRLQALQGPRRPQAHVYDEDLVALVDDEIGSAHDRVRLVALTVIAGTMGQSATIDARRRGSAHHRASGAATGRSTRSSTRSAAGAARGRPSTCTRSMPSPSGTDAQAEVSVRLATKAARPRPRRATPTRWWRRARAYVAALNKLQALRAASRPAAAG